MSSADVLKNSQEDMDDSLDKKQWLVRDIANDIANTKLVLVGYSFEVE